MTQQNQSDNGQITSSGIVGGHRRETERRRRSRFTRILSLAGVLLLITALVIPTTGYFVVFVQPHRETAVVVNDTRYTWGDYLTRLKMIVAEAQAIGTWQPDSLNNLIFDMVNDLERREIVKQYAPLEGVAVTEAEIENTMKARILGTTNVADSDVPESEYRDRLRLRLEILQISEDLFREVAREQALQDKLETVLKDSIPAKLEQRRLYEIRFSSSDTDLSDARAALDRYDAGESFQDLARELSDDSTTADQGGDLGWIPRGIKEEYDEIMGQLADGEVSGTVITETGVSLFLAEGELELRDIREEHVKPLQDQALRSWIASHRADLVAKGALSRPGGGLSSERYNWVLTQLKQDRELFPIRSASE